MLLGQSVIQQKQQEQTKLIKDNHHVTLFELWCSKHIQCVYLAQYKLIFTTFSNKLKRWWTHHVEGHQDNISQVYCVKFARMDLMQMKTWIKFKLEFSYVKPLTYLILLLCFIRSIRKPLTDNCYFHRIILKIDRL